MNKDFKEALEKEADNYALSGNFKAGAEWAYTYLHKEGGKDLVTGVRQDSIVPCDAQVDSSNSIEQEGGYYYELFKFFSDEHNLTLLDSEIQDIIHVVNKFQRDSGTEQEALAALIILNGAIEYMENECNAVYAITTQDKELIKSVLNKVQKLERSAANTSNSSTEPLPNKELPKTVFNFCQYLYNQENPYDYVDDPEKLKKLINSWLKLPTLEPEQWAAVQDYEIENALLATLVIENIRGIPFAINKLRQLFKNTHNEHPSKIKQTICGRLRK